VIKQFKKIIVLFFFCSFSVQAQSLLFPQDYFFDLHRQREALKDTSENYPNHLSLQPFQYELDPKIDSLNFYLDISKFGRRLLYEHLIRVKVKDPRADNAEFKLSIDPLFNFQFGTDINQAKLEKLYINSRGILLKAAINDKLKFESAFFENQATFANYIDKFVTTSGVVPGQGRYKSVDPKKNLIYDYAFASGVLAWEPSKNFSIFLGHGKNKIGNGYRSLLLSDNAFNYPYVRFSSKFFKGKVQYSNIYASLMNMTAGGAKTPFGTERLFQKKAAAFHHLSIQLHKRLNVSFFEGMIWQAADSSNRQYIDAGYLNPVIFTHAAAYGLNGKNNVLIGGDIQLKLFKSMALYAQVMMDHKDTSSGKIAGGFQAGFKYYDVFTLKNLFIQAEFNSISHYPYTSSFAGQEYAHYNQGLAYPFSRYSGSELVLMLAYNYKRIFGQFKVNMFNNESGFDNEKLSYGDFKAGFIINPRTNMNICAGVQYRDSYLKDHNSDVASLAFNSIIYFSLRTSLYNVYWDF
jgi:hypothetical protein